MKIKVLSGLVVAAIPVLGIGAIVAPDDVDLPEVVEDGVGFSDFF